MLWKIHHRPQTGISLRICDELKWAVRAQKPSYPAGLFCKEWSKIPSSRKSLEVIGYLQLTIKLNIDVIFFCWGAQIYALSVLNLFKTVIFILSHKEKFIVMVIVARFY